MADIADELPESVRRPQAPSSGATRWLRSNLFGSVFNTILTFISVYLMVLGVPPLVRRRA